MSIRYLVTGGAGFIGSNLVEHLLAEGHYVRVLDNFSTGFRANLEGLSHDVEIVEGDLLSYERVHNAVRSMDIVLHMGALPSVPRSVQDPLASANVNILGTLNVLLASRDESVSRVVFASSSSVYGANQALPKREDLLAVPLSPYASSKLSGESFCRSFSTVYEIETLALRFFNVYGPRQNPQSQYSAVIPRFVRALQDGAPVCIYGDGEQTRDFTYVSDVVSGVVAAAMVEDTSPGLLNLAGGHSHSVLELLRNLETITGREADVRFEEPRTGDVRASTADPTAAKRHLGWETRVSFMEGLRRTVEWLDAAV